MASLTLLVLCILAVTLGVQAGFHMDKDYMKGDFLEMLLKDGKHNSEEKGKGEEDKEKKDKEEDGGKHWEVFGDMMDFLKEGHHEESKPFGDLFKKFTNVVMEMKDAKDGHGGKDKESRDEMTRKFIMYLKFQKHIKEQRELEEKKEMEKKEKQERQYAMFVDLVKFCKKTLATKSMLEYYLKHIDEQLSEKFDAFKKCMATGECAKPEEKKDEDKKDGDEKDGDKKDDEDKKCEEKEEKGPKQATCLVQPNPSVPSSKVSGVVLFFQESSKEHIKINVTLEGFDPLPDNATDEDYKHGFHVHQYGNIVGGCGSAGGHYNPHDVNHGGPEDEVRHPGDFGNLKQTKDGELKTAFTDRMASMFGQNSIIGRAIVVHAGADDLGRGGDPGSLANGNAGPRLACCVIALSAEP